MAECPVIEPAGRTALVFNDALFGEMRRLANVPDDFANQGWCFDNFECGGGKGGCPLAAIGSKYVVKELSSSDHQTLLEIAQAYADHVRGGETLLCAILLHFEDVATGRKFFAMKSATGDGPFLALYDLKGCNDDKTLELMGEKIRKSRTAWSSCACSGASLALARYNAGKKAAAKADLVVTKEQRAAVMRRLERDTRWLAENGLMDYSLLVGVKTASAGFMGSARGPLGQHSFVRACTDGSEVAVCVAIIDFLQRWTLVKKAAEVIKVFESNRATISPGPYAERFLKHFGDRFTTAAGPTLLTRRPEAALIGLDAKRVQDLIPDGPKADSCSQQLLKDEAVEEPVNT